MSAWIGLLRATTAVTRRLEDDLEHQHGLSLNWFDVLNRLELGGGRLRLYELEERSVFTRSGMTRLCDRMEAAGHIRRERSVTDRRGVEIAITPKGRENLAHAWPDHRASIERYFARFLTDGDTTAITTAAAKVLTGLDEPTPTWIPATDGRA
jgi:DNA-binding MarR family transcriptional regulator